MANTPWWSPRTSRAANYILQNLRKSEYAESQTVAFRDPSTLVMDGLTPLLDPQAPPDRKQAALVRLRRYAGMEPGYQPLCRVMRERAETQMTGPGLTFPSRDELEAALGSHKDIRQGLQELFVQSGLEGWEAPLATLKEQLADYDDWVRDSLLPRAREDFRLTPEAYLRMFESRGISGVTPEQLAGEARQAFTEIGRLRCHAWSGLIARVPAWRVTLRICSRNLRARA